MRNILQLLGGVAVAGAVAAGATAFTAGGLTTTATGANSFIGGIAAQTVNGTTVDTVTYGYADVARTQLDEIVLHFADTNSAGAAVAVVSTVSSGTNPTWTCTAVSAQGSTCTANAPFQLTTTDNVTGLSITVN